MHSECQSHYHMVVLLVKFWVFCLNVVSFFQPQLEYLSGSIKYLEAIRIGSRMFGRIGNVFVDIGDFMMLQMLTDS